MKTVYCASWLLLAFTGVLACPTAPAQQVQVSPANRTIAVTTTEDAERRADTATIHIGYQLYAPTSQQVSEQASQTSKAITDALAGLPKDALESENQSTGPVQDFQNNGLTPEEHAQRKFQTQQSWTVRVPADAASKTLAAAVSAGANQSGGIDWSVSDESSLSAEAAGKALKHAQAIAQQMAAGLGARLGPLVYASNEAQQLRVLPLMARAGALGGVGQGGGTARQTLSLSAPMVRRSATVSAVFSLQ